MPKNVFKLRWCCFLVVRPHFPLGPTPRAGGGGQRGEQKGGQQLRNAEHRAHLGTAAVASAWGGAEASGTVSEG